MSDAQRAKRGRSDRPDRRDVILQAVIPLVAEHGVRGVTHRRVAAAAGVPLAATTYYFATLDEMIEQAFARVVEHDVAQLRREMADLGDDGDFVEKLARVVHRVARDRRAAAVTSELVSLSFRNERAASVLVRWSEAWESVFVSRVDPLTARVCVMVASSIIESAGPTGDRYSEADTVALLRRAIDGPSGGEDTFRE